MEGMVFMGNVCSVWSKIIAREIHPSLEGDKLEELYNPSRSMMSKRLFVNLGAAAKGLLSIGNPRCAHMGCKLHWNATEKSWDCVCHGSRFEKNGGSIDNPAKKRIRP
jgi:hypothetical protein